jgi:hypothetical protein
MLRDASLIPLSHQHHNGLALCVMTRRSLAADATSVNVAMLARRATDRYELELVNHFEIEEQVLFPVCGPMPLIAQLLAEHRMIEGLIAQLRTTPTGALLEQFCALLSGHIRAARSIAGRCVFAFEYVKRRRTSNESEKNEVFPCGARNSNPFFPDLGSLGGPGGRRHAVGHHHRPRGSSGCQR